MNYNFDPELAAFVGMLPEIDLHDLKAARSLLQEITRARNPELDTSALEIEDRTIPGSADAPQVSIRTYLPRHRSGLIPALISIHGGGFVIGNIDMDHVSSAMIATQLGITVVSVDYRLAPENPFPAGLEDCYATLVWMHDNASELDIDVDRIGVLGQSAGGGLAAALTLLARDRGGPGLCFQCLDIPELDDQLQTTSMRQFVDTPLWNRPSAELSWRYYLGESVKPGSADVSPYAAPARAMNLSGLPPTYISAMEFDPLRDEGIIYALRLMESGVPVELHTYPGAFHGSSIIETAIVSQRQQSEMIDVLRRGLRISPV